MAHIEEGYYKHLEESNYIRHFNNVYNSAYTLCKKITAGFYELPVDGWYFLQPPSGVSFWG